MAALNGGLRQAAVQASMLSQISAVEAGWREATGHELLRRTTGGISLARQEAEALRRIGLDPLARRRLEHVERKLHEAEESARRLEGGLGQTTTVHALATELHHHLEQALRPLEEMERHLDLGLDLAAR